MSNFEDEHEDEHEEEGKSLHRPAPGFDHTRPDPQIQFVRAFSGQRGNLKLRSPCSHLHYNPVRIEATFALSSGVEDFCCLPYWR